MILYSKEIEETKKQGMINALKDRINTLQWEITSNAWSSTIKGTKYIRLQDAIDNARIVLDRMEATLDALQELEPDNK